MNPIDIYMMPNNCIFVRIYYGMFAPIGNISYQRALLKDFDAGIMAL